MTEQEKKQRKMQLFREIVEEIKRVPVVESSAAGQSTSSKCIR